MTTTRTIRASIHQDAIQRVSEFFNATTSDILKELLQNARRSSASRVEIHTDDNTITIRDDGEGIRNPAAILAFGQSQWDRKTTRDEHPAGMGLYALARCQQATIRSKHAGEPAWQVSLNPEHFVGETHATIESYDWEETPTGTQVTFTSESSSRPTMKDEVRHYPLPVTINGEEAERQDFLAHARRVEEWQGVRIGIYPRHHQGMMNFHGVIVKEPKLPEVETIPQTPWTVQVDVGDCPNLQLTLPARREVVENDFMAELRQACRAAVYRAMALEKEQVDVPKKVQDDAAQMGITLPDATPRLVRWEARAAKESAYWHIRTDRSPVEDNSLLIGLNQTNPDQQTLERAAQRNNLMDRLFQPDDRMSGYTWYDRLTRASEIRTTVTDEDGQYDLDEMREEWAETKSHRGVLRINQRPDSIELSILCNNGEELRLPTDTTFLNDGEDDQDDPKPLVTKDTEIEPNDLAGLMLDAFFWPSDDGAADSFETQEEQMLEEYQARAIELLSSWEEAQRMLIITSVQQHVRCHVPRGATAIIRVNHQEPIQVTLEEDQKDTGEDPQTG